jgi:hypothetical protein
MAEESSGLDLMDGERLLLDLRPHPLSFSDMYFVWVWIILLSVSFMFYGEELSSPFEGVVMPVADGLLGFFQVGSGGYLGNMPAYAQVKETVNGMTDTTANTIRSSAQSAVWLSALFFSSVVVSVFRIEWKWIALMVGTGLVSLTLTAYLGLPPEATYHIASLLAILGVVFVDLFRRAHRFFVTDRRIVTEVRFGGHRRNELSFDKINNLVLEQGLLGRVFDFGTVIPATASGLGMGSDFAAITLGTQGSIGGLPLSGSVSGGRSVQVPRVRSMYGLWGVPEPEKVQKLMSEQMHAYVEAPYLKKVTEQLDDLRNTMKKGGA